MALGSVTIVQLDNAQGGFKEVERTVLFVGQCADEAANGKIFPICPVTDLDTILGAESSELKTQILAAIANAKSENFFAYAMPLAENANISDAVLAAMDKPNDINPEIVAICTPISSKMKIQDAITLTANAKAQFAKLISVFLCTTGPEADETWNQYAERVKGYIEGAASERVSVTPNLHTNNLGVICGRLCNPSAAIADTPMRVKTGSLIALGEDPKDAAAVPLTMAIIKDLSISRFSVPQWYPGYDGIYWGDHPTLAPEGSDYQEYENLRVMDFLARRVRILAIAKIADRSLNSTAASIEAAKMYFSRPLREAAKPVLIGGSELPGLIRDPDATAIQITWPTRTSVNIGITAKPYNCPKSITVYMQLDLSGEG